MQTKFNKEAETHGFIRRAFHFYQISWFVLVASAFIAYVCPRFVGLHQLAVKL